MADPDRSAAASAPAREMQPRAETGASRPPIEPRPGLRPVSGPADRRTSNAASSSPRRPRGPLYAALDLGTNNCRLLIARPHENSFRVLDGFTRIVRLGEGLSSSGRLSA